MSTSVNKHGVSTGAWAVFLSWFPVRLLLGTSRQGKLHEMEMVQVEPRPHKARRTGDSCDAFPSPGRSTQFEKSSASDRVDDDVASTTSGPSVQRSTSYRVHISDSEDSDDEYNNIGPCIGTGHDMEREILEAKIEFCQPGLGRPVLYDPLPPSGDEKLDKYLRYLLTDQHNYRFMHYSGWHLDVQGCRAIAAFLRLDAKIRVMTLSDNKIDDDGVTALVVGLRENQSLVSLDLQENLIMDMGAFALAECLQECDHLIELHLSNNHIGDEGAHALACCISGRSPLRRLTMVGNPVTSAGKKAVERALATRDFSVMALKPVGEKEHTQAGKSAPKNIQLPEVALLEPVGPPTPA